MFFFAKNDFLNTILTSKGETESNTIFAFCVCVLKFFKLSYFLNSDEIFNERTHF